MTSPVDESSTCTVGTGTVSGVAVDIGNGVMVGVFTGTFVTVGEGDASLMITMGVCGVRVGEGVIVGTGETQVSCDSMIDLCINVTTGVMLKEESCGVIEGVGDGGGNGVYVGRTVIVLCGVLLGVAVCAVVGDSVAVTTGATPSPQALP